jgi:hypothetical protein
LYIGHEQTAGKKKVTAKRTSIPENGTATSSAAEENISLQDEENSLVVGGDTDRDFLLPASIKENWFVEFEHLTGYNRSNWLEPGLTPGQRFGRMHMVGKLVRSSDGVTPDTLKVSTCTDLPLSAYYLMFPTVMTLTHPCMT